LDKHRGKETAMSLYASWVHGHNVQLERVGAPNARSKESVNAAFRGDPGDIVDLGSFGAAACLRIGWAARFVVFDSGAENLPKSGSFWCHYAIPTPVIEAGQRAQADTVLVNWESTAPSQLAVAAVHVWDGNKRIFNADSLGAGDFDGGIDGNTTNASVVPNLAQLYRGNIALRQIFFGVGVSLLIRATNARDSFLEIRSVGIDFQIAP
jgi:hypothetical protein